MAYIIALFAAEGDTTSEVTAQPAAQNAGAPLRPRCFVPSPRLSLLPTVRALNRLRRTLAKNPGYSLVFLQFLGAEEFCKLLLA